MTFGLVDKAPQDECTVDITPRRLQNFRLHRSDRLRWTNRSLAAEREVQSGAVEVDQHGLVTIEGVRVTKGRSRIRVSY